MRRDGSKRWGIALAGVVLQMALGTVYAWSFFQNPVMEAYGWKNVQVMWVFSLAICALGLSAATGGMLMAKTGPTILAATGAALYGGAYLLGACALALRSLPLLYLGFGVVGGIGLGLGYVTPVATAAKWFPDKKGLVTGMVIMGFGLGALVMSKLVAPLLMALCGGSLVKVFSYAGLLLIVMGVPAGLCMRNPPAGFFPQGYTPVPMQAGVKARFVYINSRHALMSSRFVRMWLLLLLNTSAGIMFIGMQSPMLQDLLLRRTADLDPKALAKAGATLIAVSSIFNGFGRFFWGGVSDKIGRTNVFRWIFATQILVFTILVWTSHPMIFAILVCYVLLCYGGGFGTMPAYVLDVFGVRLMPVLYGIILTGWSAAGIIGPQIAAFLKDTLPGTAPVWTYAIGGVLLASGLIIALTLDDR